MIWARLLLNCQNCCELDEAPPTLGVESWPNYLGVWRPLLQYSNSRHSPWRGCHSRLVVAARGKGKLRWWWAYALHWGDLKNFSHRSNSLLVWRPGVYRSSLAALSSPRTVYVFPVKDSSYWQDSAAGKSQGLPKSSSPTWRSENLNNSKVVVGFGVIASPLKPGVWTTETSWSWLLPHIRSELSAITLCAGALKPFLAFSRLVVFACNRPTLLTPIACVNFLLCWL